MSIIVGRKIFEEIEKGNVKIEPFDRNNIGPGSIDLNLGNKIRVFKKDIAEVTLSEGIDLSLITDEKEISLENPYVIKPGEMILGITAEKVSLSSGFIAWIEGRSRFARLGLSVHVSSGYIQPGTTGYQVLEIVNSGPVKISLVPNIKVCQIVIEECSGEGTYGGRYKDQNHP